MTLKEFIECSTYGVNIEIWNVTVDEYIENIADFCGYPPDYVLDNLSNDILSCDVLYFKIRQDVINVSKCNVLSVLEIYIQLSDELYLDVFSEG